MIQAMQGEESLCGTTQVEDVLPESLYSELEGVAHLLREALGPLRDSSLNASTWFARGAKPRNPMERAIESLVTLVSPPSTCVGMEYWFYYSDGDEPFFPHYDKDESHFDHTGEYRYPIATSVLFLSDTGAPNVVFEVSQEAIRSNPQAWMTARNRLAWPQRNRCFVMPGKTLHGVIPPKSIPKEELRGRMTFLTGWWDHKPSAPMCEPADDDYIAATCRRLADAKRRLERDKAAPST